MIPNLPTSDEMEGCTFIKMAQNEDRTDRILWNEDDIWIVREYHGKPEIDREVILYCELNGDYSFDTEKFARTLYKRIIKAHVI